MPRDLSPLSALDNARRAYKAAEQECPHWDYESDGAYGDCCSALADARQTYRAAIKRYNEAQKGKR